MRRFLSAGITIQLQVLAFIAPLWFFVPVLLGISILVALDGGPERDGWGFFDDGGAFYHRVAEVRRSLGLSVAEEEDEDEEW